MLANQITRGKASILLCTAGSKHERIILYTYHSPEINFSVHNTFLFTCKSLFMYDILILQLLRLALIR